MATTTGSSSDEYSIFTQIVEDVRTLAGKTLTISFWAKSASGTPKVGVEIFNVAGTGGSGTSSAAGQSVTISTAWTRYSVTIINPSLSGATVGTNSYTEFNLWCSGGSAFNTRSGSVGNQTATIDFWGLQIETGSVATPVQTATGTLQGELAACQRYYFRTANSAVSNATMGFGMSTSTTAAALNIQPPTPMRVFPTSLEYANMRIDDGVNAHAGGTWTLGSSFEANPFCIRVAVTGLSGLTASRSYFASANTSGGYLGFSAEL